MPYNFKEPKDAEKLSIIKRQKNEENCLFEDYYQIG
jgi:hypothetical protein